MRIVEAYGAGLVDCANIQDVFASDLGQIDVMGTNVRFTFYVDQYRAEGAKPAQVIVSKLVMPRAVIYGDIQRVLFALGEGPAVMPRTTLRLS